MFALDWYSIRTVHSIFAVCVCVCVCVCSAGQTCTVKKPGENVVYTNNCKNGENQVEVYTDTCQVTCKPGYYHEHGDKNWSCLPNNDRNSERGRLQQCVTTGHIVFLLSNTCKTETHVGDASVLDMFIVSSAFPLCKSS